MTPIYALAGLFLITALLYSGAGFGGGSTYTALLVLSGTAYTIIPIISLGCNISVVTGNVHFAVKHKLIDWRSALPLVMISVPLSFIGGTIAIDEHSFVLILAVMLFLSGSHMLIAHKPKARPHNSSQPQGLPLFPMMTGGLLGFISGVVGIGGGIFLAPILHYLNWNTTRQIAATCSLFILINSCAGLAGQLTKWDKASEMTDIFHFIPLIIAVSLGGFIGRRISLNILAEKTIKRLTALLILFVAVRLAASKLLII